MVRLADYRKTTINEGDTGSKRLAKYMDQTLELSDKVQVLEDGMGGLKVVRIGDEGLVCLLHSATGDHRETDLEKHTKSMIDNLFRKALDIGAEPVAYANVLDVNNTSNTIVDTVAKAMIAKSREYKLPCLNGEYADLGKRVNPKYGANVTGTLLSTIPREFVQKFIDTSNNIFCFEGTYFTLFEHDNLAIALNSDGIGTKPEVYVRNGNLVDALQDSLAMKVDDVSRFGGTVVGVSDVLDYNLRSLSILPFLSHSVSLGRKHGFPYIVQPSFVGDRILEYREGLSTINISGSSASLVDEYRLENPLRPSAGEYVIILKGKDTPRSNGISTRRGIAEEMTKDACLRDGVIDYQDTPEGRRILEFMAEPSTVFYKVFKEMIDEGIATSVYHMSGGAMNGKLARPLAKQGLYLNIEDMFEPCDVDKEMALFTGEDIWEAYSQWPLANEAFITTKDKDAAIAIAGRYGLEAKVAGILEYRPERPGVDAVAFNGEKMYFSGAARS